MTSLIDKVKHAQHDAASKAHAECGKIESLTDYKASAQSINRAVAEAAIQIILEEMRNYSYEVCKDGLHDHSICLSFVNMFAEKISREQNDDR